MKDITSIYPSTNPQLILKKGKGLSFQFKRLVIQQQIIKDLENNRFW